MISITKVFRIFTSYLNTLEFNKIINSKTVFISPDYTTEGIKSKEESAFLDKTTNVSLLLESQSNKGSSNLSLSSHHPITSLSNFPLSTNSCVNIKGAELEVILNNDIFYTLTHNWKSKLLIGTEYDSLLIDDTMLKSNRVYFIHTKW